MSKIFIVGIVASGKTTLAKKLSIEFNIPYYEGDCIAWNNTEQGRFKRTPEQQIKVINEIDSQGSWIIEGTYRESYRCLFDMSDIIIFLDTPLWKRKYRIILRYIRQKLHIEKCHYKSDANMLKLMFKWTKDFENSRADFEKLIHKYDKKLLLIKNVKTLNKELLK